LMDVQGTCSQQQAMHVEVKIQSLPLTDGDAERQVSSLVERWR
jgi:hypothetical protein